MIACGDTSRTSDNSFISTPFSSAIIAESGATPDFTENEPEKLPL